MLVISEKIKNYLEENKNQDINQLILKGSPFKDVKIDFLVQQISARNRLSKKLPNWVANNKIIFPPQINLEQTSSETTANYKSKLIQGETIIDLTGGFGIDSHFFAKHFKKVIHLEINKELIDLAIHNAQLMNSNNIEFINTNSIDYLNALPHKVDAIYIDPSRRNQNKSKVFQLQNCTPNILENWTLIASKTNLLLIKTSPFLDLKLGIKELKNVFEIHIVSVKNEVKELLWLVNFKVENTSEPKIKCIDFNQSSQMTFEGNFTLESTAETTYLTPQKFLYEPMSSIMKSGLFNLVSEHYKIKKLDVNTHLYTSEKHIENFSGKVFEIKEVMDYKTKLVKKRLKSMKLNVVKKNFPILVKDLIQKFKIKEGGEDFVFFTTSQEKKIVILCKRIL